MKKNNNMKQLKELVNNSVAELVRLHVDGVQGTAKAAKTAGKVSRIVWRWLNTRHLFGDDSEAVTLTGWQYLGVGAVAIAFFLLFAIKL